ncbi:HAD family hydrolase [Candidatus Pacearchaeota archaeon]|nr:HAD family hydrolase [Candidatus Pacearchaeota archaeon]
MIKVVALDIYGTVLAIDDEDNVYPPRKGIENFFDNCKSRKINVVSASDADIGAVKIDLEETFSNHNSVFNILGEFDGFFYLNQLPVKDFSVIIGHYDILPKELLVIGDNAVKDVGGAKKYGCLFLHVPEYFTRIPDGFDFAMVNLRRD